MTNQEWLSSISSAECYKAINWLLNVYGKQFTSTEVAVTQWLESDNCFGTADAISFRNNFLEIHDLKTGNTSGHVVQLMIYEALFRLEYDMNPNKKEYDAFKKYCEERGFEFAFPAQAPIERKNE